MQKRISYTYSLVFAADMYATVFKKDPLDPALGKLYRDKILLVGGSREETESLEVRPHFRNATCSGSRDGAGLLGPTAEFGCILEGDVWASSSRSEPVREDYLKARVAQCV